MPATVESFFLKEVSVYSSTDLQSTTINLDTYCIDQDIEIGAVKLQQLPAVMHINYLQGSRWQLQQFFKTQLEKILQKIYDPKINLFLCGDINVNYLKNNSRRSQLDALLMSYNLVSTVNFPTRIHNNSSSIIDNIFMDSSRFEKYTIFPLINGLSDHDAQVIIISVPQSQPHEHLTRYIRKIKKHSMADCQFNLSYETWDSIF